MNDRSSNPKTNQKQGKQQKQSKLSKARLRRKRLAEETIEILQTGILPSGSIQHLIEASVKGTLSYPETADLPRPLGGGQATETHFSVVNTTTLAAAESLLKQYPDQKVAVLNFASAKNPGGGFLNGAMAQEESLALHSGLYACLKGDQMYDYHRTLKGRIYSDCCIYSPNVPVFRRESDGSLLEDPWSMAVISSPCLNRSAMTKHTQMTENELKEALKKRMLRLLLVLAAHHSGNLVLGAWGCGVFGNEPSMIARLFSDCLRRHPLLVNRWDNIVFAVLDNTPKSTTINPFLDVFGGH